MHITPFALERWQSVFEHEVEINLAESGVQPVSVRELVGDDGTPAWLDTRFAYIQTNGTPELRAAIAAMYRDAGPDDVVVTTGGAEANFISCWHLVEPGDEVVVMQPNYLQIRHLCDGFGATVRPWRLRPQSTGGRVRWAPDLDALAALVTARTKLIAICNPNNPTGACLTAAEVTAVCDIADAHGAWVLSDEIYRGVEADGAPSPTAWGRAERVIVTSGLAKAYGLPGLRIGWVLARHPVAEALWSRRDYTTLAPGALSDRLARVALEPRRRAALLARARDTIAANATTIGSWVEADPSLTLVPAEAGAIAFVRYEDAVASATLATRIRDTASVLVVPGAHFGLDGYLRIGIGGEPGPLRDGLARIAHVMAGRRAARDPAPR